MPTGNRTNRPATSHKKIITDIQLLEYPVLAEHRLCCSSLYCLLLNRLLVPLNLCVVRTLVSGSPDCCFPREKQINQGTSLPMISAVLCPEAPLPQHLILSFHCNNCSEVS